MPRVLPVTKAVLPVRSIVMVTVAHARNFSTSSAVPSVSVRGARDDPLEQARRGRSRVRPRRTSRPARAPRPRCMHSTHRTGAVSWSARSRFASAPVVTGSPLALAMTGNAGSAKRTRAERLAQPVHRRRHQRRVEGAAHLERQHPLGAARLAAFAGARSTAAGSPEMTVWSGALRLAATATPSVVRGLVAGGLHLARSARPSTAAIAPGRCAAGLEHQLAAPPDQPRRVRRGERARGHVRAVLAEAVPRRRADSTEPLGHDGQHGGAVRENRGLGVVGEGELVLGALPHDAGERHAERLVDGARRCRGRRESARPGPCPIPTFCAPWPGHISTVTTGRRRSPR